MQMKEYLIDTFAFNDWANKKIIEKMKEMPEPGEVIRLVSHLINSMKKWMARIGNDPKQAEMSWFDPVYEYGELETKWNECLGLWMNYLESHSEEDIHNEIRFIGFDGSTFSALPKDMALQLNYHSIHHRAQICTMIRLQGLEPPFIEYIGRVYKRYPEAS